ncbi:MAG: NEAT domain-containing protein [Lachnospiraceae bacterium]|nr:NEAT domain-containing protein [Lachnospiraceae bacterium]
MNYGLAEALPELSELQSGTWYWDVNYVFEGTLTYSQSGEESGANKGFRALLESEVSVEVEGTKATATFYLSENGKTYLKTIYRQSGYYYQKSSDPMVYNRYVAAVSNYSEVEIDTENYTFTLEFDLENYSDMVFGTAVKFLADGHSETHTCNVGDHEWYYHAALRLSQNPETTVILTDTVTVTNSKGNEESLEVVFETTSTVAPTDAELSVEWVTEGTVSDKFSTILDGTCRQFTLLRIQILDSSGNALATTLTQEGTLKIQIPSDFAGNKLQYLTARNSIETASSAVKSGDYYTVSTNLLGYYALVDAYSFEKYGTDLAEGTYVVEAVIYHMIRDNTSMANAALQTPIILEVDSEGNKRVYFTMEGIYISDSLSYMADMWYYGDDVTYASSGYPDGGTLYNMFISAYQTWDDGSYMQAANSLYTFGQTLFFDLPSDNPVIPVQVRVPAMDVDGTSGIQECRFCIDYTTATLVSSYSGELPAVYNDGDLPTVEDAIEAACAVVAAAEASEFTAASWSAVQTAAAVAEALLDDENAEESALQEAYWALRTAMFDAEAVGEVSLDAGLYTTQVSMVPADSDNAEDAFTAEARVLKTEEEDGEAWQIVLEGNGIAELEGLACYDAGTGEWVQATVTREQDEETGDYTTVELSFTLSGLLTDQTILYTFDSEETTGKNGYLVWGSDFTAQSVDRTELEEAIVEAQAILAEAAEDGSAYDAAKLAALSTALTEALAADVDALALQEEIDAQTASLTEALDNVLLDVNLEALRSAAESASALKDSEYTSASWAVLTEQLAAAQKLIKAYDKNESVSATEVAQTLTLLTAATEGLVARGDKTALQELYDEASAIEDEGQACYDVLQTVLADVKDVLDDADAVQSVIDAAASTLEQAVINLYGGMDKTGLTSLVEEIQEKSEDGELEGYTEASLALLNAALATAQEVLADNGATQQEVDKQIELLTKAYYALVGAAGDGAIYVGTYSIDGYMKHATKDTTSMGNAALVKPMTIQVTEKEDGTADIRLYLDFQSLTLSGLQGYLASLYYYPEENDEYNSPTAASTRVAVTVEEEYDVIDTYNDPETGTDATVKGSLYPKTVSLPLDWEDDMIWVEVYVPIMEEIDAGNGSQYAKLVLDWDSLTQLTGVASDDEETQAAKEALQAVYEEAAALLAEVKADDSYSETQTAMLTAAAAAAEDALENLNISASAVTNTQEAVEKAMAVFSSEASEADKSTLAAALETAQEALAEAQEGGDIVYASATATYLEQMISAATKVYNSSDAVAGQISAWVSALERAVENLTVISDRTELRKALEATQTYLDAKESYTAADLEVLQSLYDAAAAVYETADITQEEIDAQVKILNYAVNALTPVDEETVDKTGLYEMIRAASALSGRESLYTEDSLTALITAIEEADAVYHDEESTMAEVCAQTCALADAILNLKQLTSITTGSGSTSDDSGTTSGGSSSGGSSSDDSTDGSFSDSGTALDRYNLADGTYYVTGTMFKINKSSTSMANAAINHTVKITVSDGAYYVTLELNGLYYAGLYGYLKNLSYYQTGYGLDAYGEPTGTTAAATIVSYQTDDDGSRTTDDYGTDYPAELIFPLIAEAVEDGYAPLQVFVPVMEYINEGSGTQNVYLYLDWSTLTTDGSTSGSSSSDSTGSTTGGTSSSGDTGSTSSGSSTNGGSSTGSGSSTDSGSSSSGTSTTSGDDDTTSTSSDLDPYDLEDGVYKLTGKMVKVNKTSTSMANAAINTTVKLTVSNGKYYLTLDFCGLNYGGKYGYLGTMKYYKTGYSTDSYGNPTGSLGSVTVLSYQTDDDGTVISDDYGTYYPNQIQFPLISEAIASSGYGYVPLQVYVPIMEAISSGSGTQNVYLRLNWSTLTLTTDDSSDFEDNTSSDSSDDDEEESTSSLLSYVSTLSTTSSGSSSSGSSSSGSSTLGSSSLGTSSLKSSTSSLSSTSALESDLTSLDGEADDDLGTASLVSALETGDLSSDDAYQAGSTTASVTTTGSTTDSSSGVPVIPIVTSLIALAAGLLYKLKSRGLLPF